MIFRVIVEAEAERDWHEAVMWYDAREPGVGRRLNKAILETLNALASQPGRFVHATQRTRKAKISPPWPYSVYFTISPDHREVKVIAIWHGARNPAELARRLR